MVRLRFSGPDKVRETGKSWRTFMEGMGAQEYGGQGLMNSRPVVVPPAVFVLHLSGLLIDIRVETTATSN
ncbi:unnamed protein product [Heligmosomoides polygyrus]|uniref:TF-B3 domain-containing protein n=1 Tax=Heligmosomoides polygyrus TaxID=6339 RepID=A0A183FTG7_HELPZ|nr:unnamed protein product [Heligmosomoides polygyrus]